MSIKLTLLLLCLGKVFGISNFPLLLIISFDGFRYNYFDKVPTPNFIRFKQSGVYVPEMSNVYVTQTFPNHFSIATGRYVEDHGVVGNSAYDPKLGKSLDYSTPEFFNYDKSVMPLWSLNEMEPGRYSGTMMWIGGEHPINNITNTYSVKLNKTITLNSRLDTAIQWLKNGEKPANVVFLYYENPDSFGHWKGPDSPEIEGELTKIDEFVGYLMESVERNGLTNKLNIILTTDHGMGEMRQGLITITDYLDDKIEFYGDSPLIEVRVKSADDIPEIYERFKKKGEGNHFKVFLKEEFPEEYHFKHNRRVMDILLQAEYPYQFDTDAGNIGNHGYDNKRSAMHGFLMAVGPAFKQNYTVTGSFSNLDIYPTACEVLGLAPYPNNGTLQFQILKHSNEIPLIVGIVLGVLACMTICVASAVGIYKYKASRQHGITPTAA